jgi:hypothetical protein
MRLKKGQVMLPHKKVKLDDVNGVTNGQPSEGVTEEVLKDKDKVIVSF